MNSQYLYTVPVEVGFRRSHYESIEVLHVDTLHVGNEWINRSETWRECKVNEVILRRQYGRLYIKISQTTSGVNRQGIVND